MPLNQNTNKEDEQDSEAKTDILAAQGRYNKAQTDFLLLAALINSKVTEFNNYEE